MDRFVVGQACADFFSAGPAQLLRHRALVQPDVSQPECRQGILPEFDRVIPGLLQQGGVRRVQSSDALQGFAQVGHRQRFIGLLGGFSLGSATAAEHVEHQHGKVTGQGPAAFTYQGGNGDA